MINFLVVDLGVIVLRVRWEIIPEAVRTIPGVREFILEKAITEIQGGRR